MSTDLEANTIAKLSKLLAKPLKPPVKLTAILRLLAKYRSEWLSEVVTRELGVTVQQGPFAGMQLLGVSAEGCYLPKFLGCYEMELHPYLLRLPQKNYEFIIDIGCAEGYYAIGLARLLPAATVHARDSDPRARSRCRKMAEINQVSERVQIAGEFQGEDFAKFAGQRTLVFCDIEGAETALLDPARYPGLAGVDIIVEMHDSPALSVSDLLVSRFQDTHDIEIIRHGPRDVPLPALFSNASDMDRFLAVWEWRGSPTPWAVMTVKNAGPRPPCRSTGQASPG